MNSWVEPERAFHKTRTTRSIESEVGKKLFRKEGCTRGARLEGCMLGALELRKFLARVRCKTAVPQNCSLVQVRERERCKQLA